MDTLQITGVQTVLHWENPEANYALFEQKLSQIQSADLVVLPEMFSTGFSMNTDMATEPGYNPLQWMRQQSSKFGFALAGSYMIKEQGATFNRLSFVTPEGTIDSYDKKHLFTLAGEQQHYSAGNKRIMVAYKGWKLGLMICYDLRFPVWCRRTPAFDFDALIFVANWPDRRSHAWRCLLLARAIENQAYVIGVNRVGTDGGQVIHSGYSAVIDPLGKYLITASPFKEDLIQATLTKLQLEDIRQRFPFFNDRDEFTLE